MRDLLNRALWTGVQTGLGLLSADSLGLLNATSVQMLIVAAFATVITALKVISAGQLARLERRQAERRGH